MCDQNSLFVQGSFAASCTYRVCIHEGLLDISLKTMTWHYLYSRWLMVQNFGNLACTEMY